LAVEFQTNIPLAPYTTFGVGGPAELFAECRQIGEIREALDEAGRRSLPVLVLGGGSNLLVSDTGFAGLVIRVAVPGVALSRAGREAILSAGAGVEWDSLVACAVKGGFAGIECLSGIPGSVGATPVQNVGAYGQEVSQCVEEVEALDAATGKCLRFKGAQCAFAYRTSRFKTVDRDRYVITRVSFRLRRGSPKSPRYGELLRALDGRGGLEGLEPRQALARIRETVLDIRRSKSMLIDPDDPDTRSAGSFFLNPVLSPAEFLDLKARWTASGGQGEVPSFDAAEGKIKVPAAWLVEQAGFSKGMKRGGAGISHRHALALVNAGGPAKDLIALAETIEAGVCGRFGIQLEREVRTV
jgi:UDP-N-acetylmuramate dehydrogenase